MQHKPEQIERFVRICMQCKVAVKHLFRRAKALKMHEGFGFVDKRVGRARSSGIGLGKQIRSCGVVSCPERSHSPQVFAFCLRNGAHWTEQNQVHGPTEESRSFSSAS